MEAHIECDSCYELRVKRIKEEEEKTKISFEEWRDTIYKPPKDESYYFEWDGTPIDGKYIWRDMVDEYNQFILKDEE